MFRLSADRPSGITDSTILNWVCYPTIPHLIQHLHGGQVLHRVDGLMLALHATVFLGVDSLVPETQREGMALVPKRFTN